MEASARLPGVCTFGEDPSLVAPDARPIWQAALDPGVLSVTALPIRADTPDLFDPCRLEPWLTLVPGEGGREHALLSDGYRHIRIDVEQGSLAAGRPVLLHHRLTGIASAEAKLLPLRRLIMLCRTGRFAASLFPDDRRIEKWLTVLRVHDALNAGASQRDIAVGLYGPERISGDWRAGSDSLRSRVRRLAGQARRMAAGGYRTLLVG
jgi:hypothetical protein